MYKNRGIKETPQFIAALDNRMYILDAMDDHISSNMLTALHVSKFRDQYHRKDLTRYVFQQRQKKYRIEPSMDKQVKVFFKQKFQEVHAIKEQERDFKRRKKVEKVKKQARLQKGHR